MSSIRHPSRPRRRAVAGAAVAVAAALGGAAPGMAHDRAPAPTGQVREYWIKAVDVHWDVAPNGRDPVMGRTIAKADRTLTAIVYRAYTAGWRRPLPNTSASGDNDGMPGPTIQARVGDRVVVHFKNEDRAYRLPHSMHFHGFRYAPASDGSYIPQLSGRGAKVPVGGSFTYRLTAVPGSAGVWPYHDHSPSMDQSISHGLYGVAAILGPDERPPDRRFVVEFGETLGFNTIDGKAFIGNTPTFHAKVGDRVEWDVIALGDMFHTFHVHGHRWRDAAGANVDTQALGPGDSYRIRWTEDAPGTWYYHCHVESHQMNGMIGLYRVDR